MKEFDEKIEKINIKFQKIRQRLFFPIIVFLTKIKVSANIMSVSKIIPGILFLFLIQINIKVAILVIFFGVILDFFDGPLARHTNTVSDRGKFIDMFSDYIVYACFIFGMILINAGDIKLLSYNIIIIPILYLLIILNKNEKRQTDWIIHPEAKATFHRMIIELSGLFYLMFNLSLIYFNYILLFANILATIHATYHFFVFINGDKKYKKPTN